MLVLMDNWRLGVTIAKWVDEEYVLIDNNPRQIWMHWAGNSSISTEQSLALIQQRTEKNCHGAYVFRR